MGKHGITTTYKDVENLSVGETLERSAEIVPHKVCVFYKDDHLTYNDLNQQSNALAASLQRMGIEKGDRVSMYMSSCPQFYIIFYALQKIGAIVAWANPAYKSQELRFILSNSQAKAVFVQKGGADSDNLAIVQSLQSNLPDLTYIIALGAGRGDEVILFEDVLLSGRTKEYVKPAIDTYQDLSMLIYTSGTTGVPKGSMITHYQAVRGGYSYVYGVDATMDDIFAGILPMSHSFGCGSTLIQPILIQASVILFEKFDPEEVFKAIETDKITLQHGSPTHYILEINHPNVDKYDLSSLRAGYLAGQICPEEIIQWGEERHIYLASFWGNSEIGPVAGTATPLNTPVEIRKKCVGKPILGTEAKAINPETGEEVGVGETGELMVRGPHVLKGYWNNKEETEKQLEKDGWLHTGDLVSIDENGFIRIYGRSKDLINRGGLKIYPSEIESLILQHPAVSQVCVVGTPNPVLGENICACVIPKEGVTVSLIEMRDFLKNKVAKHKLPDELFIVSDFPKLAGGVKINKYGPGGVQEIAASNNSKERIR